MPLQRVCSTIFLVPQGRQPHAGGVSRRFLSDERRRRVGCVPLHRVASSRNWVALCGGCGSIVFGGVKDFLLAAWRSLKKTGGSRRRQRAVVPIGTKKVVGLFRSGLIVS